MNQSNNNPANEVNTENQTMWKAIKYQTYECTCWILEDAEGELYGTTVPFTFARFDSQATANKRAEELNRCNPQ